MPFSVVARTGLCESGAPRGGISSVLILLLVALVPLFVLGPAAIIAPRSNAAHWLVYAGTGAIAALLCADALLYLISGAAPESATLPIGLPWLPARFRLDVLSAFFLAVVNGGAI